MIGIVDGRLMEFSVRGNAGKCGQPYNSWKQEFGV